jgi:hypothetical protein
VVQMAYHIALTLIVKAQAVHRGHQVRQRLSTLLAVRLETYKRILFSLWCRASTPLTYRTKFWPSLQSIGPVRLFVAEQELKRLITELNIELPVYNDRTQPHSDIEAQLARQLGVSHVVYWKARKVRYNSEIYVLREPCLVGAQICRCSLTQLEESLGVGLQPARKVRRQSKVFDAGADRLLAERTQIYERLSSGSPTSADRLSGYFNRFAIPLKEKKKKVALTEALCKYPCSTRVGCSSLRLTVLSLNTCRVEV